MSVFLWFVSLSVCLSVSGRPICVFFCESVRPSVCLSENLNDITFASADQYRLCPANETLDEECFRRLPLSFASTLTTLEFDDGTSMEIPATHVSYGTRPEGSTW